MNNPNPFQNAAQNPFVNVNNNNNNNRRVNIDRQEAMNIRDIQEAMRRLEEMDREENMMAPKSPTLQNRRARFS